MIITNDILQRLSEKYDLDFNNFKYVKKKKFFQR